MPRFKIDDPDVVHYLTFSCFQRKPLFVDDFIRNRFVDQLDRVRTNLKIQLFGYVVMLNHVHVMVKIGEIPVAKVLKGIKQPFSYHIRPYVEANHPQVYESLHRCEGKSTTFRFWLPGGGFDDLLTTEEECRNKLKYTHRNPVRAGLVELPEQWRWSSFRYYLTDEPVPIECDRPEWL